MQFTDLIRISLRQVIRQRRRNIGVFFAIALGTAGLIVIITMSEDVKSTINRDLELMGGATRLKVDFESANTGRIASRPNWFRDETLEAMRRMPGVDSVSLAARRLPYATAIQQDQRFPFLILAVDDMYARVNDYAPADGRFLHPGGCPGPSSGVQYSAKTWPAPFSAASPRSARSCSSKATTFRSWASWAG